MREGLSRPLWLALVVAAFCLPLFIGLGRTDLENDEAIYSFAVDEILANGDWLNPRASPHHDAIFLEKPPLKFWIVAAPIRLGLLPHDEFGLRFWDAVFGGIAFLYVFAIGGRLGGPLCGVVAVMVLFVYRPLLFDHGLRGNNMEAPLFLCYCGGIYHYLAWGSLDEVRTRRRHVVALALYFLLGFMTKFVAALFLPLIVASTALALPDTRRRLVADARTWLAAGGLVIALVAPWFIYQQMTSGNAVWNVMFGTHVVTRFTDSVDVFHVNPWNYYWVTIWKELSGMGTAWLAVAGLVLLAVTAVRRRRLDELVVAIWLILPLTLMSLGTSKLHHYAYPFVPPAALAVGFVPGWIAGSARRPMDRIMSAVHVRLSSGGTWNRWARQVLLGLAVVATVVAIATLVFGRVTWQVGGVTIIRNSHVARPLVVALVLATLGGRGVTAMRFMLPLALLMLVLPINVYEDVLGRARLEAHPLRRMRDCLVPIRAARLAAGLDAPGIHAIGETRWFLHSYFYYLHRAGGWERSDTLDLPAVTTALFNADAQRPILIGEPEYRELKATAGPKIQEVSASPLRDALLLLPGPYATCGPPATTGPKLHEPRT